MRSYWIRVVLSASFIVSLFTQSTIREDDPPPITKKDLRTSKNYLQQIALAFMGYNDDNFIIASHIYDKDGKQLLSWRVAILPCLDEEKLYKQFKLDEP
ncbi:MAG TPA: DUF1559 domain-containing protein [Gemmata sp.]|jgi:hypothetical protein|nr:DUF1559 domain-containing protein [Gemmata sp.]